MVSDHLSGWGWRSHRMFRAPYRRRWLVLLSSVIVVTALAIWFLQPDAGGEPAGQVPAAGTSTQPTTAQTSAPPPATALINRAAGDGKIVALTFDDGPHPVYTPRVLELLARHGATATFCMVGAQAIAHPELVRQVAAAGMRLCAHSISHDESLRTRAESVIAAEIAGSKSAIVAAARSEIEVGYFRAPAGNWSDQLALAATQNGMRPLSWSVDSRDWTRPGATEIVSVVRREVQPGAIILLHDGGGQREQTLAALEELLPWLIEQGYRFVAPG